MLSFWFVLIETEAYKHYFHLLIFLFIIYLLGVFLKNQAKFENFKSTFCFWNLVEDSSVQFKKMKTIERSCKKTNIIFQKL